MKLSCSCTSTGMAESYQHVMQEEDDDEVNEEESLAQFPFKKQNNTLPLYGNKESMNINSMILTNIVQSPYFKQDLYQLKTFHEVVDEIYYRVRLISFDQAAILFFFDRLNIWNRGRKTVES